MKNLSKLLVIVLVITFSSETFAQKFGVKAGMNLSNMLMKDDDETYSDEFKMKPGFHAGVTAEIPVDEIFSVETGLFLSTKGFKMCEEEEYMDEYYEMEAKINLLYLDIPILAKVSYDTGGLKVFGALGPYIGMGISGKTEMTGTYNGDSESETEDVEWGSENDLKRLDYGLSIGAGVEINSIVVGVSYNLGLANIAADSDYGDITNNRVLAFSIGYILGER